MTAIATRARYPECSPVTSCRFCRHVALHYIVEVRPYPAALLGGWVVIRHCVRCGLGWPERFEARP
jgi:hypothetical protein